MAIEIEGPTMPESKGKCPFCGERFRVGGSFDTHVENCDERPQPGDGGGGAAAGDGAEPTVTLDRADDSLDAEMPVTEAVELCHEMLASPEKFGLVSASRVAELEDRIEELEERIENGCPVCGREMRAGDGATRVSGTRSGTGERVEFVADGDDRICPGCGAVVTGDEAVVL